MTQDYKKERIKELSLLFDISKTLDSSLDLKDALHPILGIISEHKALLQGSLTLLNRETGEISIEAAYGLSPHQQRRGRYKVGEGILGKVFQTGKPAMIPKVSEEPLFLNRTGALDPEKSKDVSYLSVPIKLNKQIIGALSIFKSYSADIPMNDDLRLYSIIASMISQAVRLRQEAQENSQRLIEENLRLKKELKNRFRPSNIIGTSSTMQEVYDLIAQVSRSEATVLICGESGTGKELVAHAIHYNSLRANKPLIKVNCAALPESIIESELFGHEKGAFTGAVSERKGRFELAHGGTLFLDEIGDLTPSTQIKLLRVLQEKEFERVGSVKTTRINVRLITATNLNLESLIKEGKFRQDLYYRLNVFPIHMPPLQERKSDILLLADTFVEKYSKNNGKHIRRISTPAIDMLMAYHWPGNVRELENCIERAVLLSSDNVIHGHHLPPTLQTAEASGTAFKGRLNTALENVERELIQDSLKSARGNSTRAARALGITERIMGLRIQKYGIVTKRFRPFQKPTKK